MLITLIINGEPRQIETDPRTLLLHLLREELNPSSFVLRQAQDRSGGSGQALRGTKYGCGEGECGVCTVLLNGRTVNACLVAAGRARGGEIITVEAMAQDEIGRKVVEGFVQAGAVQCGFCTPGFVLSARTLLAQTASPDAEQIQRALSGNLCRCTGYAKIIEAVTRAAETPVAPRTQLHARRTPITWDGAVDGQRTFVRPSTLDEALRLLAAPDVPWRVIAGGTDLLVRHEHHVKQLHLLDLGALDELRGIEETDDAIHIGALTTYTDIIQSPVLRRWAPALAMASREVGGMQIQNMGTLGGNLVNASPAADSVPPLFVLDARLVLRSARGERRLPVHQFATGPGRTVLARDELLTKIILPKLQGDGRRVMFFEKVGPRKAQTIAKASVALCGWLNDGRWRHIRIALGAVAPTVLLASGAAELLMFERFDEDLLLRVADQAAAECSPIDDIRSTATYRRKLVRGLLVRNLWKKSDFYTS